MVHRPSATISVEHPSPHVRFLPFADGMVLFWQGTNRIWVLNQTAAFIWCLLDEISTMEELVMAASSRFSVDPAIAQTDATATIAFFQREGLLGSGVAPTHSLAQDVLNTSMLGPLISEPSKWNFRQCFSFMGHVLEFRCQDIDLGRSFSSIMSHLAVTPDISPADTCLWVLPDQNRENVWHVCLDSRLFAAEVSANQILPHLLSLTFIRFSRALSDQFLLHAAVLYKNNRVTLFPADTGCGKTTIAAALVARGWRFFSDELAVINVDSQKVVPFPLPMSIKNGSMTALKHYYPQLAAAKIHERADGKRVRYLVPPYERMAGPYDEASIEEIIFPRFTAMGSTNLTALDRFESLNRLVKTGSSDRELGLADIKTLISVIDQTPCFELLFSDLEEAIHLIEKHIS